MKRQVVIFGLFVILVIVGLSAILQGCTPAVGNIYSSVNPLDTDYAAVPPQPGAVAMASGESEMLRQDVADTQERLIVRSANLSLTLDDPAAKIEQIEALAVEMGGWVVSANLSTSGTGEQQRVSSASISIRVESARLDEALDRIKAGVGTVNSEAVTGEDVTSQYVDVRSRVANLEAAEQQLQAIMEDARRTEDVLAVFDQLTRIRGEIESLRGQMQYFEQASSFSAIQVQLIATPVTPPIEVGGWRPLDAVSGAAQALVDVLQGGVNIIIYLVVFILPLLLLVGLPIWLIGRFLRGRRNNGRAVAPQP